MPALVERVASTGSIPVVDCNLLAENEALREEVKQLRAAISIYQELVRRYTPHAA